MNAVEGIASRKPIGQGDRTDASTPSQDNGQVAVEARARLTCVLMRVGQGDAVAFEQLYRITASKLMSISFRMCRDRAAAEDILQDVYLRVWNRASSFDPARGSAIAWLAMIARNRAIDWLRLKSVQISEESDEGLQIADGLPLALDCMIISSDHLTLVACLDKLEERQRDAIRAAFYSDDTYADIARRHGVPLGTVKSWIRRGMIRLKTGIDGDALQTANRDISSPTRVNEMLERTSA